MAEEAPATPEMLRQRALASSLGGAATAVVATILLIAVAQNSHPLLAIVAFFIAGGIAGGATRQGLEKGFRGAFVAALLGLGILLILASAADVRIGAASLRDLMFAGGSSTSGAVAGPSPETALFFSFFSLLFASFAGAVGGTFTKSAVPPPAPAYPYPPPPYPYPYPAASYPQAPFSPQAPQAPAATAALPAQWQAPPTPIAVPQIAPPSASRSSESSLEKKVDCPGCGYGFVVRYTELPTPIECPACGKKGTLRA